MVTPAHQTVTSHCSIGAAVYGIGGTVAIDPLAGIGIRMAGVSPRNGISAEAAPYSTHHVTGTQTSMASRQAPLSA
jgi:hypothetical protein